MHTVLYLPACVSHSVLLEVLLSKLIISQKTHLHLVPQQPPVQSRISCLKIFFHHSLKQCDDKLSTLRQLCPPVTVELICLLRLQLIASFKCFMLQPVNLEYQLRRDPHVAFR